MISVDEARATILGELAPMPPEAISLWEARGRVLCEAIHAPHDVPPFRNAAMDGYAVRAEESQGASPQRPRLLRVAGRVAAGELAAQPLAPGEAVRIMTGAPVPAGADAVVRFEESSEAWPAAQRPAGEVALCAAVRPGDNVREAGEDLQMGQRVLEAGARLGPAQLGVLASLGQAVVRVVRRPRVAILATGDELLPFDGPLLPGKIRNSNELVGAAMVAQAGGIPLPCGIARDSHAHLAEALHGALARGADLLLTSAGVSVGDFDVVKEVLAAEGEVRLWQVAVKPGKPLAFGWLRHGERRVPLLGLPGNPVAAMVAFHLFAAPAIRLLGGRSPLTAPTRRARLLEPVENSGRRHYMRGLLSERADGGWQVTTRGSGVRVQGSGILSAMLWANCFVVVPEGTVALPAGAEVTVELFAEEG